MDIAEWKTEDLIRVLEPQPNLVMEWLKEKSDIWHQRFYALLDDFISSIRWNYIEEQQYRSILEKLRIVRCSDGIHRSGPECHFLNDDAESDEDLFNGSIELEKETQLQIREEDGHREYFYYVATGIYLSGRNWDEKVRKFLLETIGVLEVNETERIKMILKQRYTHESIKPRKGDLERFIQLVEEDENKAELFKSYPIFQNDRDLWASPEEIFLDSPYLATGLTTYYEAIKTNSNHFRRPLSPKYAKSDIDPKRLGEFAKVVGVQTKLDAIRQKIPDNHPERWYLIDSAEGRWRYTGNNEDYIIPEFKALLDNPSIDKSRLIWQTMCSLDERCLESWFWNNKRYMNRRPGKSSLVHDLRNAEWIPQKDDFVYPCDALREQVPEDFSWPKGYPHDAGEKWLDAIEFGKAATEQREEHIQQDQTARDLGFDSGDDAKEWGRLYQAFKKEGISIDDVKLKFSSQNSGAGPDFPTAPARNPERRSKRIVEELKNKPKKAEVPDSTVHIRRREIDRHTDLRELYTNDAGEMTCQICEKEMPFKKRDGEYYFEAVEILTSHYFPIEHETQYLALCPECAARYKYFVKEDITMMEDIKKQLMTLNNPKVFVQLGELEKNIRFVESHLLDLKTVLHYYEDISDPENSSD